jgi:tRNA threonylcarbamoyladenosine biosynthesis protein TsaB
MPLRILALETSTLDASVAVLEDECVLGQVALDRTQRTTQSFAPAIAQQLHGVGWRPQDVQLVAVTIGPGSFTGLRVGVTAAKAWAYAVGADVLGLPTLQVIARQAPVQAAGVSAVLDAQRQQLFVADFLRRDDQLTETGEPRIVDAAEWLASLSPGTAVTGPGLARLHDRIPADVQIVAASYWTPQAATVGQLAYLQYQSGNRQDLWTLNPVYYRSSAAEERWRSKSHDQPLQTAPSSLREAGGI